ncbi:MAG: hypothetical protein ACE5FY_04450 [Nitrospiria bacterium]
MKWLLLGGIILWNGAFVFAQTQGPSPLQSDSILQNKSRKKEPVTERLLMGGTEIQGTIEKPHVVYVVPWKDAKDIMHQEIPLERSFREEILKKVDYDRFRRQWGRHPRLQRGGKEE